MKVWRNSEGREFPANENGDGQLPNNRWLPSWDMKHLGYELVDEEEEFEVGCVDGIKTINCKGESQVTGRILDGRLIPGKTYLVREKV